MGSDARNTMPSWAYQLLQNQRRTAEAISDLAVALSNLADGLDREIRTQRTDEAEKKGMLLAIAAKKEGVTKPSTEISRISIAGSTIELSGVTRRKIFWWAIVAIGGALTHVVHWFIAHKL